MSGSNSPSDEVRRLVSDMEDGALGAEGEARLSELLQTDSTARSAYYDHAMLVALLRREGRRTVAQGNTDDELPIGDQQPQSGSTSRRQNARSIGWKRRWSVAVAASILLILAFSVGEVTGLTQLVPTIIRVVTGEGSLIIEVNDPSVSVTLDGEDIIITGAGVHELKLSPGTHRVVARKDGQPTSTELVTIERGGRKVITVTFEPSSLPLAPGEHSRFMGHSGPVFSVAISDDNRRIVSTSQDGTARVWDTATGKELTRFEGHDGCVYCAVISTDGTRVLSGSGHQPGVLQPDAGDWSVCLWEIKTGKELRRIDGQADGITAIAISATGDKALLGGYSGKVLLWDIIAWKEIARYSTTPRLWSVVFSPDESHMLTGSGYRADDAQDERFGLRVWNLANGQELNRFGQHPQGVWKAIYSPSGDRIASTGGDHSIRIWNALDGTLEHHFLARDVPTGIACSTDGKFLLTGNYGTGETVCLWNLETKQEIQTFAGHTSGVQSVAISNDGKWAVSGSHDYTVRLWTLSLEAHRDQPMHK